MGSGTTVTSHLRTLEQAGIVSRSRLGQTRPCALEPTALSSLGSWLGQLRAIYEDNYERLDALLEKLKSPEEGELP